VRILDAGDVEEGELLDGMHLWLAGKHVGPADAVLPGGTFFCRAAKAVKVGRYTDVLKAEVNQK
jgi:hypothetical protein